jgi:hypothetical protein
LGACRRGAPYFCSRGDDRVDGVVVFRYSGSWSEFPVAFAISLERGREAVREFFATGVRPESVAWTEV